MSKVIRPQAGDYQSWRAPAVEQKRQQKKPSLTQEEVEQIKQQARREGFNQGYKEGKATGEKFMRDKAQILERIIQSFVTPLEELDETVEDQLMQLALAVAKQIIRREIKQDPGQIMAVIREAVSYLPVASGNVSLVLHPEDAALAREVLFKNEDSPRWQISDDPGLNRGDCKVVAQRSHVDATVESRIAMIAANLLGGERGGDA